MREPLKFDYYYGVEAEQFSFYRVPRLLIINGEDYPYELVKSRFLKLNSSHVEYVMGCMRDTVTKITNIRSYLITALYNAPSTMTHYYQQEVQHDLYGGG